MGKERIVLVGLVLVLILGVAVWGVELFTLPFMIHGYDGPEATLYDVNSDYDIQNVGLTSATLTPKWSDDVDLMVSCGVKFELMGAPNVLSYEEIETLQRTSVIDTELGTNTTTEIKVQKVKCQMGATVSTYQGGIQSLQRSVFTVLLRENTYSIFSDANESLALIINVYTRSLAQVVGSMTVTPMAGGYDFPLTPVGQNKIPDWVLSAGYTEASGYYQEVTFDIVAEDGAPTNFLGFGRSESSATLDIGFDVWLFGVWKYTKDIRNWEWPTPDSWLEILAAFMWFFAGIIITALAIWKLKGKMLIAVIIGVWVLVLWMSGVLPEWLKELGVLGV